MDVAHTLWNSVCKQACVYVYLFTYTWVYLDAHRTLCNLGYITSATSAWLKTFIDAESPSVPSQSGATWTMQDELGKLWLDCVMSRERKTMTFFLGKVTAQPVQGDIW